ncbi:MAG: hypothetical protein V2I56_19055 [Desulfobacteraceae bacterium]|jgi:AAT family amino acid transporter|nr:hypothetical protein [Desulfobacteraceae bacterium]
MGTQNIRQGWLTERQLAPRWNVWASGLLNLVVLAVTAMVVWWIFFSNGGPLKLYTPLLGFSLVIWVLLVIIWQTEYFDYWPLKRPYLAEAHPLQKGGILTVMALGVYCVFIFGIMFYLIGRYGITYFNWNSLTQYGELGQDVMSTRETTSWAFICLSVPFLWLTTVLMVGGGKTAWPDNSQPGQGLANWLLMALLSVPLFLVFFHPHIGSMFYPAQVYTAVPPWWKEIAGTNSAEYGLGILFCSVIVIFITLQLWEGRPWILVRRQPWKFIVVAIGGLLLGFLFFKIQLAIMDYLWDEAYIGGQNEYNFGWRYSHTVTMGNFILVPAIVLGTYFGEAFAGMAPWLRGLTMSVLSIILGLLFAWAYYAWAPALLGVCEGVSHPSENPSAFLVLLIVLLNIHDGFMDKWPGYRLQVPEGSR